MAWGSPSQGSQSARPSTANAAAARPRSAGAQRSPSQSQPSDLVALPAQHEGRMFAALARGGWGDGGTGNGGEAAARNGDEAAAARAAWLSRLRGAPLSATHPEPCCICLEPMCKAELAITLPCGHLYHAPCIRDWLERRQWCPLCKTVVV